MWKSVKLLSCLLLGFSVQAADLPTGHTPGSKIWIDYSDLDHVLSASVLDMGPSTHERAYRLKQLTGTRLVMGNQKATRLEGNRVAFHLFEETHRDVLRAIRDDLLSLPEKTDIAELSRNHQLAYWLNLHNSIVLAMMAEEYPVTNLEPFFDRGRKGAFIVSEAFQLGQHTVTLADVQDHILANWQDPLVIYGFYMGAIGTPNVRKDAFKGDQVYDQLRENAYNFVNSVRGTQIWKTGNLRVASYYRRMAHVFPNFEDDVLRHIQEYARPKFARRLVGVATVDARIDDWNIADLYNGHLHQAAGSLPRTVDDWRYKFFPRRPNVPPQLMEVLEGRKYNLRRYEGRVQIDELSRGTVETEATPGDKDGKKPDEENEQPPNVI